MDTVKHLLTYQFEGAPVWMWLLGVVYAHWEWWLGRTQKVQPNSTLSLVAMGVKVLATKLGILKQAKAVQALGDDEDTNPAIKLPSILPWLLIGVALSGCGNPILAAKRAMTGAAAVLKAANSAWIVADLEKQNQIIEDAGSDRAKAIDGIMKWRQFVQPKINQALATADGAMLAAARALALAEGGMTKNIDLLDVVQKLWAQLEELRRVLAMYEISFQLPGGL